MKPWQFLKELLDSKLNMLNLPKDEMAFRKIYLDLLEQEKITTIFRPGKRDCGEVRGYCPSQLVTAKVLENIGADWAEVPPKFIEGFSKNIVIKSAEVKKIKDFTNADFIGSSPEVHDIKSLKYHLGVIYNLSLSSLSDDALVTKITFEYKK